MKRLFSIFFLTVFSLATVFSEAPIKVACIGNSITYGAGIANHFQNSYPGILQTMLGGGYDVRNFAVGGTTTLSKGDYPYISTSQFKQAQEFQPDIVTIKLGTNDSKTINWKYSKDFEKDLTMIVETFKNLKSNPKIYLCFPVPCTKYSSSHINDSTIVKSIIPSIIRVAKKTKVEIIDLHTPLKQYPNLFPDTIHPNAQGSAEIASVIYEKLTGEKSPQVDVNNSFPGVKTVSDGNERYTFTFLGRQAIIVKPKNPAPGNPWIWRPAFFGAFASVDNDLLSKGFYVVYYDLTHLYGSPNSVNLGNSFYSLMTQTYKLSDKVTLEGFSRGGYWVFNWAAKNPSKVACIYVDAPVCNILSWPGREKWPDLWQDFLKEWNIPDDVRDDFKGNALMLLEPIAKAKIPIIAVCGGKDQVVPFNENFKPVMEKYRQLGAVVELILKPDCDHHPHSLENPQPVVDFILRYQKGYEKKQSIRYRGTLKNAFSRFATEKKGCVAFLGGSITEMTGWRNMIEEDLKQRFPECEFSFIDAGISSLGSTPHAYRFKVDVLEKGVPDLLFVEAAVNDDTNDFKDTKAVRGMEGIVRNALITNPYMDIVMLHFIYDPFIPLYNKGIVPDVIMNHERVANWYSVSSIDLAEEIATRIRNGEFSWDDFGGTHPKPFGHRYYAATINRLFDGSLENLSLWKRKEHELPSEPLDTNSYFSAKLIDPSNAVNCKGFSLVSSWQPDISAGTRKQYVGIPMFTATKAGSSFEFEFNGRAVGIYGTFGPDAAVLEYSIDGAPYKKIDTYTKWSEHLFLPWLYLFEDNLQSGKHSLKVRISGTPKTRCLIYKFAVNK